MACNCAGCAPCLAHHASRACTPAAVLTTALVLRLSASAVSNVQSSLAFDTSIPMKTWTWPPADNKLLSATAPTCLVHTGSSPYDTVQCLAGPAVRCRAAICPTKSSLWAPTRGHRRAVVIANHHRRKDTRHPLSRANPPRCARWAGLLPPRGLFALGRPGGKKKTACKAVFLWAGGSARRAIRRASAWCRRCGRRHRPGRA